MSGVFDTMGSRWPRLKPMPCEEPDSARTTTYCTGPVGARTMLGSSRFAAREGSNPTMGAGFAAGWLGVLASRQLIGQGV